MISAFGVEHGEVFAKKDLYYYKPKEWTSPEDQKHIRRGDQAKTAVIGGGAAAGALLARRGRKVRGGLAGAATGLGGIAAGYHQHEKVHPAIKRGFKQYKKAGGLQKDPYLQMET